MELSIIIILIVIIMLLLVKIIVLKKSLSNIGKRLESILGKDTNALLDVDSMDTDIKRFTLKLNRELENLRTIELEYKNHNRELRDVISNISHDIRTPLTAVRGYFELIEEEGMDEGYLEVIRRKLDLVEALTNQLYGYAFSIDKYKYAPKEEVNLNEVLEETILGFYAEFKKKGTVLEVHVSDEKVLVLSNKILLSRAFENILSNSLKYGRKSLKIESDFLGRITFTNDAYKIDRVELAHLFDRFYTVEDGKSTSGIGLSIAKQLIEISGGKISARLVDKKLQIMVDFSENSKSQYRHDNFLSGTERNM